MRFMKVKVIIGQQRTGAPVPMRGMQIRRMCSRTHPNDQSTTANLPPGIGKKPMWIIPGARAATTTRVRRIDCRRQARALCPHRDRRTAYRVFARGRWFIYALEGNS